MNDHESQLYARICDFALETGGEALTFTKRLARENGWSMAYAARAINEYRRFMFLACVADHRVTPSDQVDQVWHLHLVYTESYWNEWCGETLQQPIHHGPTKGGDQEKSKHEDLYEKTVASYEKFFGEQPPRDLWPTTDDRFRADNQFVRVNLRRHWLVRKPRFRSAIAAALAVPCLALFGENSLLDSQYGVLALVVGVIGLIVAASWLYMDGFKGTGSGSGCSTGCDGCGGCSGCGD